MFKIFLCKNCSIVFFMLALTGCLNSKVAPIEPATVERNNLLESPFTLTNDKDFAVTYDVQGSSTKRLTISAEIKKNYANLTVYANGKIVANNLDLPRKGQQTINVLIDLSGNKTKELLFKGRSAEITLLGISLEDVNGVQLPHFADNSDTVNLDTEATYKYGGPSVGDIDNDGDFDFILNNHNKVPTQLVTNLGNGKVAVKRLFNGAPDLHGSALGDYDADGDLDLIVAHGGANGTSPSSYTLFNNTHMNFENVSGQAGLKTPARGRAPRWIDLDVDGDLDLALFNAKTPNYDGPQTLFLSNNGNGSFDEILIADIENLNVEKPLVVDFDRDGKDDLLLYYPDKLSLWKNNGNFSFTNVTKDWLPEDVAVLKDINGASDIDVNNDGLADIYLANGRSHYSISNKSIDFSPNSGVLDVNDNGEKGVTQIEFIADGDIHLADMKLTFRQYRDGFPIFLGSNKRQIYMQPHDYNKNDNRYPQAQENAPFALDFSPKQALGWPTQRTETGLYIGYLGNKKWKAEWVRTKKIYWGLEFSISGLNSVHYDWPANNRNVQDVLLINKGTHYENASKAWNIPQGGNHWGVSRADFNNDGWQDLFVHRYGYLKERIADLLLLNTGNGFELMTSHGAFDSSDTGHGDMGQAFDFNNDGLVDMLNGSEDKGKWYMYLNQTQNAGNYIQFNVAYSPKYAVDPLSAEVTIETEDGQIYYQTVGSSGEVHSQSVINTLHFGLAKRERIKSAKIVWRNGEVMNFGSLKANALYKSSEIQ